MALEGTLRDFSLADILQLISLQHKTGLLALKSPDDTVTLGFTDGKLVSAESSAKRMDTRLGTVLVKTRRIRSETLQKALEIQGQTLQRLGFILLKNGFCSAEDLRAGLDIQIRKITYGLFRWTDGDYVFDQQERIDYDHEFVTPIAVEALLMEGARMMDEWPIIEKIVRSPDAVFQRVPVAQPVVPAESEEEVEDFGENTLEKRTREKRGEPIRISRAEWAVYELVDGRRPVGEISERTFLSDFEGAKAFYDLVSRGLIEEAQVLQEVQEGPLRSGTSEIPLRVGRQAAGAAALLGLGMALLLFLSFGFQPKNPLNVLTLPARPIAVVEGYYKSLSLLRLRRLAEAVDTYYLSLGKFPDTLETLPEADLLSPSELLDPWGRKYRYILQAEKYYLVGFDREGKTDIDLFFSHTLQLGFQPASGPVRSKSGKEVIVIQ